jgi:hypothetical protein
MEDTHHVGTQLCRRHCGEVWRTGVVFTATNDSYTAQLTYIVC